MTIWIIPVLGMGGWLTDPPGGMLVMCRQLQRLSGVHMVAPFNPDTQLAQIPPLIKRIPENDKIVYVALSCGSNKFSWVLASVQPRIIDAAFLIQASTYCNAGCPPIGGNVSQVWNFYTSFWSRPIPGLGSYKPQLQNYSSDAHSAPEKVTYPGTYRGNSGATLIHYIYAPGPHPGDDNTGTQAVIVEQVRRMSELHDLHVSLSGSNRSLSERPTLLER